jgi:hypothetical protein
MASLGWKELTCRGCSLPVLISVSVVAESGNEFRVQNKVGFIPLILTVTFECLIILEGKFPAGMFVSVAEV